MVTIEDMTEEFDLPWPTEAEEEQTIKFMTFQHYLEGWKLALNGLLPDTDSDQFAEATILASSYSWLSVHPTPSLRIKAHFMRGEMVLRTMKFILTSGQVGPMAMWFPVQAYYAVHALGLAAIVALGQDEPDSHAKFLRISSSPTFKKYLVGPLSTKVSWKQGPMKDEMQIADTGITIPEAKSHSALSTPHESTSTLLTAKSLTTTHDETWELRVIAARKKYDVSQLKGAKRATTRDAMGTTGVIDFLWRMRTRANYADPAMCLFPATNSYNADQFGEAAFSLATRIGLIFKAIVRAKIGAAKFKEWDGELPTFQP
jgi:hypothetical protein